MAKTTWKGLSKAEGPAYLKWADKQPRAKIRGAAWNLFGTIALHKEFQASVKQTPAPTGGMKKSAPRPSFAKSRTPRPIPGDKPRAKLAKKATVGARSVLGG